MTHSVHVKNRSMEQLRSHGLKFSLRPLPQPSGSPASPTAGFPTTTNPGTPMSYGPSDSGSQASNGFGPDYAAQLNRNDISRKSLGWGQPLLERDSRAIAAPPAVTPPAPLPVTAAAAPTGELVAPAADGVTRPATAPVPRPAGMHPSVTWWRGCGRPLRAGDVAPSRRANGTVALDGPSKVRSWRSTGPLSESEARKIVAQVERQSCSGAFVVAVKAGRPPIRPCSIARRSPERTRSVMRWTMRVLGRPVGIRGVMAGLRAIGYCE